MYGLVEEPLTLVYRLNAEDTKRVSTKKKRQHRKQE